MSKLQEVNTRLFSDVKRHTLKRNGSANPDYANDPDNLKDWAFDRGRKAAFKTDIREMHLLPSSSQTVRSHGAAALNIKYTSVVDMYCHTGVPLPDPRDSNGLVVPAI